MTRQESFLCKIAISMHECECTQRNKTCDFNPCLKDYEEWTSGRYVANKEFIELATRVVKLMNEKEIRYKKFIKIYSKWNRSKHVSKKMKKLLNEYGIIYYVPSEASIAEIIKMEIEDDDEQEDDDVYKDCLVVDDNGDYDDFFSKLEQKK